MKAFGDSASMDPASLLSAPARALYLSAIRTGGRLTAAEQSTVQAEVQELLDFGLLVRDLDDPPAVIAVDPKRLSTSLSAAWQREAAQLLARSVALTDELRELGDAFSELSGQVESSGKIEYVQGKVPINQRLAILVDGCSQELLTAQPGGGRRPDTVRTAINRDLGVLRRGGTTRTIYQPSARYSSPTLEYVETMTQAGSHIRTLDEPFNILIVVDRKVAIIPGSKDMTQACFVTDEAVISYLIQTFDSLWERAIPFQGNREVPPQVLSSLRRQIIRSMLQGVGHRVIARNLGLSERTLARHIAEMREEYGVDTLFQLGWKLAQETDDPEADDESAPALD
ncbi:helix-turn-helix domain-containing protein [Kitasatospora sp. NPDC048540]|uniref:helix-turn-helix domain-containing protein n=1 Tax=unclassified Kitasatospora TaxID=2633591 RepID=UPI000689D903|nr:helix-turn-helix domain-containing protein [Kitasatospora sp. MBT63]